ncbi:hypothetical protein IM40_03590 [Candidatus Paracaedimonas acanthamoebae]|nr:hypothetical protein IM40_03590 [Candidatus Paracaedimonas acanthamoebae]
MLSTPNETKFLLALFKNPYEAESAYNELLNKGYKQEDITLIMSNNTHETHFTKNHNIENKVVAKSFQQISAGGAIGGAVGVIAAALITIGATAVPGLGITIVGSLAAIFAGIGAGAATGSLVGALIGTGISNEDANKYEQGIKEGGIVIGITPPTTQEYEELKNSWAQSHALSNIK